jgi:hypothetical protein
MFEMKFVTREDLQTAGVLRSLNATMPRLFSLLPLSIEEEDFLTWKDEPELSEA